MKEFARLAKRKNQALSIFQKAKDELNHILADLQVERGLSAERAAKEQEKQDYLSTEIDKVHTTISNIAKVMGEE